MRTRTFPVTADRAYHDAFAAFAREKDRTMAELVREAIDARFGVELQPHLDFIASRGNRENQLVCETSENG